MKTPRKHFLVGLIGNLFVFTIGMIGISMLLASPDDKSTMFYYFTVLSNVLVIATSLINAILNAVSYVKDKNCVYSFFQILKLASVGAVAITFTMVVIFLAPNNPQYDWFGGYNLFLHAVTPIAAVASFIFFEYAKKIKFRFFFVPVILLVSYGIFYVVYAFNAPTGAYVDWYGFMFKPENRIAPVDGNGFNTGTFVLFLAECLVAGLAFGFVLWLLNKIMNLIFVGYVITGSGKEPTDEEIEDEIEKEEKAEEAVVKKSTTKGGKKPNKKYKDGVRVYHVARSKFISRHWQVKLATGEKAIKIFDTQLEAINYAKQLVKTQGGSIRIHSMRGRLRK